MQLKHLVQDLIDRKEISIEGPQTNVDHGAFKNPLPNYKKGESSSSNTKGKNMNYVYDSTILHIEAVNDQTNDIKINDQQGLIVVENQISDITIEHEQNIVTTGNQNNDSVTAESQFNDINIKSNQINDITQDMAANGNKINVIKIIDKQDNMLVNATTRAQTKYVLKGSTSKTPISPLNKYNIVDQLQKIPAQISILELLKISPAHKEILEQALVATTVPNNLEFFQFQAMVGHLTAPHCLSFSKNDDVSLTHPHNVSLHMEVLIHKNWVKRVLIDGGAGLNICTLKLICALGYLENAIDARRKITIKSYDDEERSS